MRLSTLTAAALLALTATASWAQTETQKPQTAASTGPAKATPVKDPDEIICVRREEPGSRIPGAKECHTRQTWDQISQDSRDAAQTLQRESVTLSSQKGG